MIPLLKIVLAIAGHFNFSINLAVGFSTSTKRSVEIFFEKSLCIVILTILSHVIYEHSIALHLIRSVISLINVV